MARKKKPKLPAAGNAFAFSIGHGRFSVCRVLLGADSDQAKDWRGGAVFVAGSAWFGEALPAADDPALRPILHMDHHSFRDEPNAMWVSQEPPEEFIPIGKIEPTAAEQADPPFKFGSWESITMGAQAQWRWDNDDRAAVLADDAIQKEAERDRLLAEQKARDEYLGRVTLDDLATRRFFPAWKGIVPPGLIRASRKIMTRTIEQLVALGAGATEGEKMAVLQLCIESFNELDSKLKYIETLEREDICEEFETIAAACGLGSHEDLADRWREW